MRKKFDYYIFIDYSERLLGYCILDVDKVSKILPLITRFRHYRDTKNRKLYLKNVNSTIKKNSIKSYFYKIKIRDLYFTPEIYSDIAEFLSKHKNCIIFISIDDAQYDNFRKLVNILSGEKTVVKKESELKKGSPEYQLSLVIDNLLNIERRKKK